MALLTIYEELQAKIDNCKLEKQLITDKIIQLEHTNFLCEKTYLQNAIDLQKHIISIIPVFDCNQYESNFFLFLSNFYH